MDKFFICLAVSYKYGGRCIAGVEVNYSDHNLTIVSENGYPKWIRPVTRNTAHGEISLSTSSHCNVLDIVKMEGAESCPDCAQNENYYFNSIEKVGRVGKKASNLDLLCDTYHSLIFGNRGKAVHPDSYTELGYSLMLIKPEEVRFFMERRFNSTHDRLRVEFIYNGTRYDLPVTDPKLCEEADFGIENLTLGNKFYLTLSLGVEYEGWHSKLVANVISFD